MPSVLLHMSFVLVYVVRLPHPTPTPSPTDDAGQVIWTNLLAPPGLRCVAVRNVVVVMFCLHMHSPLANFSRNRGVPIASTFPPAGDCHLVILSHLSPARSPPTFAHFPISGSRSSQDGSPSPIKPMILGLEFHTGAGLNC